MKPLRIYTPVFGRKHIDLLDKALGQSLRWPKNFAAIKHARWSLLIHKDEFEQVMRVVTKVLPPEQIETIESNLPLPTLIAQRGELMNDGVIKCIRQCLDQGSQFLMATPDFIWADGSIANMVKVANQPRVCVPIAHPRVLPSILHEITDKPMSFTELVSAHRRHQHRSWVTSEIGYDPSGTNVGGILWRKSNQPGVVTVQHRMPSPYLCNFTTDDWAFFRMDTPEKRAAFGAWDHNWADSLIESGRWRMVLSSDVAFMAEVTDSDQNVPPGKPFNPKEPDSFWFQDRTYPLLTHQMNRQFISTFRGSP